MLMDRMSDSDAYEQYLEQVAQDRADERAYAESKEAEYLARLESELHDVEVEQGRERDRMSNEPNRVDFVDQQLQCKDCGNYFTWTSGEQEFYAAKELHEPKRCKRCRIKMKLSKGGDDAARR